MSDHAVVQTPTPAGFKPHVVAHHFTDAEQEFQSVKFSFWLFLVLSLIHI